MNTPSLRRLSFTGLSWLAVLTMSLSFGGAARAVDSAAVKKLLADPPRQYATAPLWVWNALLTETQIRETLRDLASQKVRQVFVHPRPGLMTPYLSPDWFRLWKAALDEAETLDMNVWIYDENSYPSGFGGGWVPELMPESRGRGLAFKASKTAPAWSADLVAVYRLEGGSFANVTADVKAGRALPEASYLAAAEVRAANSPWHGNRSYVNLLSPGVTEKFLDVTLGAYEREIGKHFGKRVPGVFTDEPNIQPAPGLPWCEDLPEQFQKRWGYSLLEHLPSLKQPLGDWQKVRHNYYSVLNELFIERWAKPFYERCGKLGLEFTGHYWDHEWPHCSGVPDNMAMAAWQHRPGVDTLMNQYAEHTHAQFGNVRYCREVSSIANQLGRERTLVELYGAGGWDLRFEDMKRIGDWLQVLGINTLDEHLSYVTLRGARKRDHPQSFSYHEPWWQAYHVSAGYFARLSAALSQGQQVNRILVMEPTTTAWMYQGDEARLKELGDAFSRLLMALEAAQVEYDLGCEDVLARFGAPGKAAEPGTIQVGRRAYHTVVYPPFMENRDSRVTNLLDAAGCRAFFPWQTHVDGAPLSPAGSNALDQARPAIASGALFKTLADDLRALSRSEGFAIDRAPNDEGILFHHRRHIDDGQILFLVNTSIRCPAAGVFESNLRGVEKWNLETGLPERYPFAASAAGVKAAFTLPPSGSLLLFLSKRPLPPAPAPVESVAALTPVGPIEIVRRQPNVLTLDYVDVAAGGQARSNLYFYQANQFVWQRNGLERNPWDSAVQFKEELISKKFPEGSGFEASYRFVIEDRIPSRLEIVIERPDLYTIACNGQPLAPQENAWWLDKAFGRLNLRGAARLGQNVVTIKASPFTMFHELEPAYVIGAFALKPVDKGFVIVPDRTLRLGAGEGADPAAKAGWNDQGFPFYAGAVSYRFAYRLDQPRGRYRVSLPKWHGSVAEVRVNGQVAGHIAAPPFQCDVTRHMRRAVNTVEVTVIGTLKNTLGPHHGNHALGSAWPGMFQQGPKDGPPPGRDYSTVRYGLFEPFQLENLTPK